jgi:hypothetical protein
MFATVDCEQSIKSENIYHHTLFSNKDVPRATYKNRRGRDRSKNEMFGFRPGFLTKAIATMFKEIGFTRVSLISTKDTGRAAALSLESPEMYAEIALVLTGDVLRIKEMN